jgi:hypothetical protein
VPGDAVPARRAIKRGQNVKPTGIPAAPDGVIMHENAVPVHSQHPPEVEGDGKPQFLLTSQQLGLLHGAREL